MNKKLRNAWIVIGTCFGLGIAVFGLNSYLNYEIERMYTGIVERQYTNQNEYVIKKSVEEGNLLLLGSSELSSPVEQNPVRMFPNSECTSGITVDGVAHVQSLLHSMNLGSFNKNEASEVQLALVVSLQWFYGEDISPDGFGGNFSRLQFWSALFNQEISNSNKKYLCERTLKLLSSVEGLEDVKVYAKLYGKGDVVSKVVFSMLKPFYSVNYQLLKLTDKYQTYNRLKTIDSQQPEKQIININWEQEMKRAEKEGEQLCTNNEFYVENEYYDTYLKDRIRELEGSSAEEKLISAEKQDFICFLSICKDLGIRPYIVMMNTNGYYYDYIGIDKDTRNDLYNWVEGQTESYGFDCLNLSEKEYEPYFMRDVMHLGWKGWLYVDQKLTEYFSED